MLSQTAPVAVLWAAADVNNLSMFDPASPPAKFISDFSWLTIAILTVIILLPYGLLLIYFLICYRQRPGEPTREVPQLFGSKPIELAWTVMPFLIVTLLFLIVLRSVTMIRRDEPFGPYARANAVAADPAVLAVQVVGHQWWWEYRLPKLGVVTANELHAPASETVHLELRSADVIHDFWAPRLAPKQDAIPGKSNYTYFQAWETGWFGGQCAEYCGNQHANMMIRVFVEPRAAFESWVKDQQQPAAEPSSAEAKLGKETFLSHACMNCHTIRGILPIQPPPGQPGHGLFGPDLTHLMSRQTLLTGMVPNNAEELRKWVQNPQALKRGCHMPDLGLSRQTVERLVAYLVTLK
jgi:cytochrome c oxidase subunit 2